MLYKVDERGVVVNEASLEKIQPEYIPWNFGLNLD